MTSWLPFAFPPCLDCLFALAPMVMMVMMMITMTATGYSHAYLVSLLPYLRVCSLAGFLSSRTPAVLACLLALAITVMMVMLMLMMTTIIKV